jgi:hypothetical protein
MHDHRKPIPSQFTTPGNSLEFAQFTQLGMVQCGPCSGKPGAGTPE